MKPDLKTAEAIGLSKEAINALAACDIDKSLFESITEIWQQDRKKADELFASFDDVQFLGLCLMLIPAMHASYRRLSIPDDIFYDNLKDIGIWSRNCEARFGHPGLKERSWVMRSLRVEIIRLGRLQFEPAKLADPVTRSGRVFEKGHPILSVHIPAEDPLEMRLVHDSLKQAVPFFKKYFDKTYDLFFCDSWLLAPELHLLLPADSRILQFQQLFEIYEVFPNRDAEIRVFGHLSDDPNQYPENSALQRSMKQFLCAGNHMNIAKGTYLPR